MTKWKGYSDVSSRGRPSGLPRLPGRRKGGKGAKAQKGLPGCLLILFSTSTAMSYPVTSQPQCANTCYQTQLSDWHTGLTDCCNDMPVCECAQGRWEGAEAHPKLLPTLSTPFTYPFMGL